MDCKKELMTMFGDSVETYEGTDDKVQHYTPHVMQWSPGQSGNWIQ